jgi:hypothetical protein
MKRIFAFAFLLASLALSAEVAKIVVGDFSAGSLTGWESKIFDGQTDYQLVTENGRQVLRAVSRDAASGLFHKVRLDLNRTPYLHWSWKVENTLGALDERSRGGDDYPARIYVVVSGGLFFWRTHAINYVWSNNQPVGTTWPSAYTGNDKMVAIESGNARLKEWVSERRNVKEDYRRLFGGKVDHIDAVAIMTDTDNSGKAATAYYGDIYFSSQ